METSITMRKSGRTNGTWPWTCHLERCPPRLDVLLWYDGRVWPHPVYLPGAAYILGRKGLYAWTERTLSPNTEMLWYSACVKQAFKWAWRQKPLPHVNTGCCPVIVIEGSRGLVTGAFSSTMSRRSAWGTVKKNRGSVIWHGHSWCQWYWQGSKEWAESRDELKPRLIPKSVWNTSPSLGTQRDVETGMSWMSNCFTCTRRWGEAPEAPVLMRLIHTRGLERLGNILIT